MGWLRAAVLGANDGIVSTASLVVGVAAAAAGRQEVLVAGVAGLVAGAMSMAAGEYVSVSSQADTEEADLERERHELEDDHAYEREELATIYVERGLDQGLARQVADQLMAHDALGAHARDELGISETMAARPVQAALASASTFAAARRCPWRWPRSRPIRDGAPGGGGLPGQSGRPWGRWRPGPAAAGVRGRPGGSPSGARWPWRSPRVWVDWWGRRCDRAAGRHPGRTGPSRSEDPTGGST